VFELLSTPERLPEWNTSVASARRVGDAPVGLGSRAIFRGRVLGQTLESETEVVGYEPPRVFATRALRGPRLDTTFRLEPIVDGTRVLVEVAGDVPGGALGGKLAERFLRTELTASLERLAGLSARQARAAAEAEGVEGGDPACWLHLQPEAENDPLS
jgi:polyketide cyclase/dehydrase/lipid transport protein